MGLPINFDPYNPIPNNPFFYPESYQLSTPSGALVVGSGLTISLTGVISASGGGGSATWATLGDKTGASGPTSIALGQDVAATPQGLAAVAIGLSAGNTAQDVGAVAIGASAGNANQGTAAVALGGGAGTTNQGACAVAIGQSAGISDQGIEALALGSQAGTTNQAACSIVINASGAPLENTTSNTTVIKPVRDGGVGLPAGFKQVAYNPVTGELVYYT
jgi:hypothetical protein